MLVLIGANHLSMPVELRERLAVPAEGVAAALRRLLDERSVDEAMILSTCNRVEVVVCMRSEAEEGTVTIRRLGQKEQETLALDRALDKLSSQAAPPVPL